MNNKIIKKGICLLLVICSVFLPVCSLYAEETVPVDDVEVITAGDVFFESEEDTITSNDSNIIESLTSEEAIDEDDSSVVEVEEPEADEIIIEEIDSGEMPASDFLVENSDADYLVELIKQKYEDAHLTDDETIVFTNEGGELIEIDIYDPETLKIYGDDSEDDMAYSSEPYSYAGAYGVSGSQRTISPFTGKEYTHDSRFAGYKVLNGIDVSTHQGTINWSSVKNAGVDCAFIRIGYRGYGDAGNIPSAGDTKGVQNVKNAHSAGVKVGVYFYSQAITEAEAEQEAQFCLNYIRSNGLAKYISLPVVIDYEYYAVGKGRLYNAHLSADKHQSICDRFAEVINSAGFTPGVYANYAMLTDDMKPSRSKDYTKYWIARWNTYTGYSGKYYFWQYSDSGSVNGISGNVDCDFFYEQVAETPKPETITYELHAPNKTTYVKGEKLVLTGAYIKSSKNKRITITRKMLAEDVPFESAGIKTVKVLYDNNELSFDVLVTDFNICVDAWYGEKLLNHTDDLQITDLGSFKWKNNEKTAVGAVGKRKFNVTFTPADTRFSKRDYAAYINVRARIGDENGNQAENINIVYNEQIIKNIKKDSKVFTSISHRAALKKNKDYVLSLTADNVRDEDGNVVPAGTSFENIMIPKGCSGIFTLTITTLEDSFYVGQVRKTVYVADKKNLLKYASILLGAKLQVIDLAKYSKDLFIPAVYDVKTRKYYKVINGVVSDDPADAAENAGLYRVKYGTGYLICGKDFHPESYGNGQKGTQTFLISGDWVFVDGEVQGYMGTKSIKYRIR